MASNEATNPYHHRDKVNAERHAEVLLYDQLVDALEGVGAMCPATWRLVPPPGRPSDVQAMHEAMISLANDVELMDAFFVLRISIAVAKREFSLLNSLGVVGTHFGHHAQGSRVDRMTPPGYIESAVWRLDEETSIYLARGVGMIERTARELLERMLEMAVVIHTRSELE